MPEFERSRQCHLVLYALCDECAVGLMKGHFVDDGALATEFNNESPPVRVCGTFAQRDERVQVDRVSELEQRPFDRPTAMDAKGPPPRGVNVRFRDFPIGAVAAEMCRQRSDGRLIAMAALACCALQQDPPFRCEIGGRHE